ncbi:MAG: class I SAM-dependent methyltransferase [Planctomycetaceae bacterium]|jgi:SAM-dependent methyltransferase|nr:class I SAM-dependent methyltransferase [Planctomycetaceae bacterium]
MRPITNLPAQVLEYDIDSIVRDMIATSGRTEKPIVIPDEVIKLDTATGKVRTQYEELPYPFRNPEDESKRLLSTFLDDLCEVNTMCFRGRRSFNHPFRALVAGGGTGDAVVFLASQLRAVPRAEIVYVDLSAASQKVARERLHNYAVFQNDPNMEEIVTFYQASLLDVKKLSIGTFDYINCSGCLHHLADPLEGLLALKSVMRNDGAMGIMVYGQIGRTTIYAMQDLLRIMHSVPDTSVDTQRRVDDARLVLNNLPSTNLHKHNGRWLGGAVDVELYDMFLHSRDRAYTIPQLYDWIEAAGLNLTAFSPPSSQRLKASTSPCPLPPSLRKALSQLSERKQAAILEILDGTVNTIEFYLTQSNSCQCETTTSDIIPYWGLSAVTENLPKRVQAVKEERGAINVSIRTSSTPVFATIETTPPVGKFLQLIDNKKSIGEILVQLSKAYPEMNNLKLQKTIYDRLQQLIDLRLIRFRHPQSDLSKLCYTK